jgi:hypothetical protein
MFGLYFLHVRVYIVILYSTQLKTCLMVTDVLVRSRCLLELYIIFMYSSKRHQLRTGAPVAMSPVFNCIYSVAQRVPSSDTAEYNPAAFSLYSRTQHLLRCF